MFMLSIEKKTYTHIYIYIYISCVFFSNFPVYGIPGKQNTGPLGRTQGLMPLTVWWHL